MKYRKLGQSDLEVSTVAMGCWAIVGDQTWGKQDEQDALDAIRAALDVGINLFDTAEGYGRGESERLLGRALGADRHRAVIASKVSSGHLRAEQVRAACEASLQRLGRDHIDLYQVHWPSREVPLAETIGALESLKQAGKIRAIGVSNFGPLDLSDCLELITPAANQLAYSLLSRGLEHELQAVCVEHGVGILPYSPLAQGLLTGKFASADEVPEGRARTRHFVGSRPQARHGEDGCEAETFAAIEGVRELCERLEQPMGDVALAWLLHQPAVTSVLAGARNPDQVRRNARAADLSLDDQTLAELDRITQPVKQKLGTNLDLWMPAERSRMR